MVYESGTRDLARVYMQIVKQPDISLREPTQEIKFPLNEENKIIIKNMISLMYQENGIGLADNQVGYDRRIFVIDTSNEKDNPQVFINPVITAKNIVKIGDIEGCLSCPGKEVKVSRSMSVNLKWMCEHGEEQHKTFYHLPGRVVQHEMDHLNGKLIIDRS